MARLATSLVEQSLGTRFMRFLDEIVLGLRWKKKKEKKNDGLVGSRMDVEEK